MADVEFLPPPPRPVPRGKSQPRGGKAPRGSFLVEDNIVIPGIKMRGSAAIGSSGDITYGMYKIMKKKLAKILKEGVSGYPDSKERGELKRKYQVLIPRIEDALREAAVASLVEAAPDPFADTVISTSDYTGTHIHHVYDAIVNDPSGAGISDEDKMKMILNFIGSSPEIMLARCGDLTHDIGTAMKGIISIPTDYTRPKLLTNYPSMLTFVTNNYNHVAPRVATYVARLSNVLEDFNRWGRSSVKPVNVKRDRASLQNLTRDLFGQGFDTIVLDAQFGNLFRQGFGTAPAAAGVPQAIMTLLDSTVSRVDGATKAASAAALNGVRPEGAYGDFSFPGFYSINGVNTNHTLSVTADSVSVTVTIGTNSFTVTCSTGISVNAICKATGLVPPRGSGEAGAEITVTYASQFAHLGNHIVLIKTVTDWAQAVYVLYLNFVRKRKTILITNDEYCLALAALLKLPYVIRTPSTKSDIVEVYNFNPAVRILNAADAARLSSLVQAGITPDQVTAILDRYDDLTDEITTNISDPASFPPTLAAVIIAQLGALRASLSDELAKYPPLAAAPPNIADYLYLARLSPYEYVEQLFVSGLKKIYEKYVHLGIQIEHQRKFISFPSKGSLDTIIDILLADFADNQALIVEIISRLNLSSMPVERFMPWEKTTKSKLDARGIPGYVGWDRRIGGWNASESIKTALLPILPDTLESILEGQFEVQGGGYRRKQRGGAYSEGDIKEINEIVDYYTTLRPGISYVPRVLTEEEQASGNYDTYKPSVSTALAPAIAELSPSDTFTESLDKLDIICDAMRDDAVNSHIQDYYEIVKDDIEQTIYNAKTGKITPSETSLTLKSLIFKKLETVLPAINPYDLKHIADTLTRLASLDPPPPLAITNLSTSNLKRLNLKGRASTSTMKNMSDGREARQELVRRGNLDPGVSTSPEVVMKGGPLSERTVIVSTPTPPVNDGHVYQYSGPSRVSGQRGSGRRRRTRRRCSRAAARRGRTFRRRK